MKALIIGSGGREHAISYHLAKDDRVETIYVAPGNAGTMGDNIDLDVTSFSKVADFCQKNSIDVVCVGPEVPLADGIVDFLAGKNVACFGPNKKAAQIEASKSFSKHFMEKYHIPTAKFKTFDNIDNAIAFVSTNPYSTYAVKASGLAAGKGVIIANSSMEAVDAIKELHSTLGSASKELVIEEFLIGEEVSALCFTDGTTVKMMPIAQDHKQLLEGDNGPMTGGMGAYAPYPLLDQQQLEFIEKEILQKSVDSLRKENIVYSGVLYAGLMLTKDGPKVLEYNCRFGDPETQVILPLLITPIYDVMMACINGKLNDLEIVWKNDMVACTVVVVSGGYPGGYKKGCQIQGIKKVENKYDNVKIFNAGTKMENGHVVTSGGRVLNVTAFSSNLTAATRRATEAAGEIKFENSFFRKDIGHRVLSRLPKSGLTYEEAGVSIDRGNELVSRIKQHCASTKRSGIGGQDFGGFAGCFDLKAAGFKDPILVSGTDGVGTKLKLAIECSLHDGIGCDLVAMCVNDVLTMGAEPLFFLDYFATSRLNVDVAEKVVKSICQACVEAGCALIGGETAEMPGMYKSDDYDIAGFCVGAIERSAKMLPDRERMTSGDVLIGIPSSGVHSNGFSLVRKIVEKSNLSLDSKCPWDENITLGQSLLTPTKIYVKQLLPLMRRNVIIAAAHITGGGFTENIPRISTDVLAVEIDIGTYPVPKVFPWLAKMGNLKSDEMSRTFNCGLGMIVVVSQNDVESVIDELKGKDTDSYVIGKVIDRPNKSSTAVVIRNEHLLCESDQFQNGVPHVVVPKKRVGVMISGSGSNLQALIDYSRNNDCKWEISLVISNVPDVKGIERARNSNITSQVINHKEFANRKSFDTEVDKILNEHNIELVCLAGFMRILTADFCNKWRGKLLNIHPSLLPSFRGAHAVKDALDFGVTVTGCTVHFATPEVDAGHVILQQAVPVLAGDNEESLFERMHKAEHNLFPLAVNIVAEGKVILNTDGNVIRN